jgi:hypothetical protein
MLPSKSETRRLDHLIDRKIPELQSLSRRVSRDRYRYALLPYLMEVLEFYRELRKRNQAKIAGERIAELYGFNLRDDMHTMRCIIEASSKGASANAKNRMTQALRYAFRRKWPADTIIEDIKENGGIKGCADKFGKENKHKRYSRTKIKRPGGGT